MHDLNPRAAYLSQCASVVMLEVGAGLRFYPPIIGDRELVAQICTVGYGSVQASKGMRDWDGGAGDQPVRAPVALHSHARSCLDNLWFVCLTTSSHGFQKGE